MCRRFFERFQESVEGSRGEHVDLVDYIDAVFADLGRNLDLVHQVLYVLDSVVGGSVQLMDAVGPSFLEGDA